MKREEWKSEHVVIKIEVYEATPGIRVDRRTKDGNGSAYVSKAVHKDRAHQEALAILRDCERWAGVPTPGPMEAKLEKLLGLLKLSCCLTCGRSTHWSKETACKSDWHRGIEILDGEAGS